jgi:hypothetical protein
VITLGEKTITVEIAPKVQVQFDRSAIQTVATAPGAEAREEKREKS